MTDGSLEGTEVFRTAKGLVAVSSPVKRRILECLAVRSMSLTELAKAIGKAQSTLSVHLDGMETDGLVSSAGDPHDSRRRIYTIRASPLASSKSHDAEAIDLAHKTLVYAAGGEPAAIGWALVRSALLTADGLGVSFQPALADIGAELGKAMAPRFRGRGHDAAMREAVGLFARMGAGDLSVFSSDPITVIYRVDAPLTRATAAVAGSFAGGFLSAVLTAAMGKPYSVTDSDVFGADSMYCRIVLEPVR
jgi:DNA-binding transcriptional ArsR family regulator